MDGKLVLVVEDNEMNMELVRDVLHAKGYRTLEATSGEAALELVQEQAPDLILLDIQLPGIDGVTTLARLRELPATADDRGGRAHGPGDGGRPGVVPRRRFRRIHLEADRRPRVHPRGRGVLRWRVSDAGRILVVDDIPENLR